MLSRAVRTREDAEAVLGSPLVIERFHQAYKKLSTKVWITHEDKSIMGDIAYSLYVSRYPDKHQLLALKQPEKLSSNQAFKEVLEPYLEEISTPQATVATPRACFIALTVPRVSDVLWETMIACGAHYMTHKSSALEVEGIQELAEFQGQFREIWGATDLSKIYPAEPVLEFIKYEKAEMHQVQLD